RDGYGSDRNWALRMQQKKARQALEGRLVTDTGRNPASATHWACWAADDLAGFKRQVPHYLKKKNLTYGYC
ncbi:MAG: hypothetical protein II957_09605, partial [Treponema sp.]|nr:hypothetical protein [Treponema sp.]